MGLYWKTCNKQNGGSTNMQTVKVQMQSLARIFTVSKPNVHALMPQKAMVFGSNA